MRPIQLLVSWGQYVATFTVEKIAYCYDSRLTPTIVSHKRFLDNVPLAINHELIYGSVHPDRGGLHDALYKRLGIDGAGADAQCERLLQEPPNVQVAREDLSARYEKLRAAAAALESAIY